MFKKFFDMLGESSYANDKRSSGRIVMYIFTGLAVCMVGIEALFTLILIVRCIIDGGTCEFHKVFDTVIYVNVVGAVVSIALGKSFSTKEKAASKTKTKKVNEDPV